MQTEMQLIFVRFVHCPPSKVTDRNTHPYLCKSPLVEFSNEAAVYCSIPFSGLGAFPPAMPPSNLVLTSCHQGTSSSSPSLGISDSSFLFRRPPLDSRDFVVVDIQRRLFRGGEGSRRVRRRRRRRRQRRNWRRLQEAKLLPWIDVQIFMLDRP